MKTLTYDQPIRLAPWADDAFATVFTVRGYAIANGSNPDEYESRARANGHRLMSTIYTSGALVGDRALAKRMVDERIAAAAGAVTLTAGQVVEIEGRPYTVRVARGNDGRYPVNCDPIHFDPVWAMDRVQARLDEVQGRRDRLAATLGSGTLAAFDAEIAALQRLLATKQEG